MNETSKKNYWLIFYIFLVPPVIILLEYILLKTTDNWLAFHEFFGEYGYIYYMALFAISLGVIATLLRSFFLTYTLKLDEDKFILVQNSFGKNKNQLEIDYTDMVCLCSIRGEKYDNYKTLPLTLNINAGYSRHSKQALIFKRGDETVRFLFNAKTRFLEKLLSEIKKGQENGKKENKPYGAGCENDEKQ